MAGCAFCKYQCGADDMYRKIQKKFEEETGVNLDANMPIDVIYSTFPYKKFLKNSNENIKEHFRKIFADI